MEKINTNDLVVVDYEGFLDNGEIFDTTRENGPLEFQVGTQAVLPAFEAAVVGLSVGESTEISIPAQEAYGERNEEMIFELDRKNLGGDIDPQPGMVLAMTMEKDGQTHRFPAMVTEINGDKVTMDFNHPLAGKDLRFQITLREVKNGQLPSAGCGCGCSGDSGCSC